MCRGSFSGCRPFLKTAKSGETIQCADSGRRPGLPGEEIEAARPHIHHHPQGEERIGPRLSEVGCCGKLGFCGKPCGKTPVPRKGFSTRFSMGSEFSISRHCRMWRNPARRRPFDRHRRGGVRRFQEMDPNKQALRAPGAVATGANWIFRVGYRASGQNPGTDRSR